MTLQSPTKPTSLSASNHGPLKQVWNLFLPLLFYSVIGSLVGLTDMILAAGLGSDAQAAVGFGDQIIFLVVVVGTGLCTACASFISRSIGAENIKEAAHYSRESQILALLIGLGATVSGIVSAEWVLTCLGCSAAMKSLAVPYVQICSMANCPFVVFLCQAAILRAIGKAEGATMIGVVSTTIGIVGSIFLFYLPVQSVGHSLNAMAIGWIAAALAGMLYGYTQVQKHLPLSRADVFSHDSLPRLRALALTALPAIAGELAFIVSNVGRYALIAGLPDSAEAQAAWTIRLKLEETLAILPLMALSYAVAVVCGQWIGAGKSKQIAGLCTRVALIAAIAMLAVGALLSFAGKNICMVFTADSTTLDAAVMLLKPSAVVLPCCAVWLVFIGGIDGAGRTNISGMINSIDALAGRLLLSCILITNGVAGLTCASTVSSILTAALTSVLFFKQFGNRYQKNARLVCAYDKV